MKFLQDIANKIEGYNELRNLCTAKKGAFQLTGLASVHKAHIIHSLCADTKHRAFVVVPDEANLRRIANDLRSMGTETIELPYKDLNLRKFSSSSKEYEYNRIETMYQVSQKKHTAVIATLDAVLQYTIPQSILNDSLIEIKLSDTADTKDIVKRLVSIGYEASDMVEGKGQFSSRGDILDIYSPSCEMPIRIEFFGDEIESIHSFDIETQRRQDKLESTVILPVNEVVLPEEFEADEFDCVHREKYISTVYKLPSTFLDYISDELIFLCEWKNTKSNFSEIDKEKKALIKELIEEKILDKRTSKFVEDISYFENDIKDKFVIFLDNFATNHNFKLDGLENINAGTLPLWNGSLKSLNDTVNEAMYDDECACAILGGSDTFSKNTATAFNNELSADKTLTYNTDIDKLVAGSLVITSGSISSSFSYPELKIQVISHGYVEGSKLSKRKEKNNQGKKITSLEQLNVGDYVVHSSHGVGKFNGIQTIKMQGVVKDYMKIMYAKDDVLYVPVTQLDMVAKYIGGKDNKGVKLNKLGTQEWSKAKKQAKLQAQDIAKDLIKIYSKRLNSKGYAFPEDTEWQRDFEAGFRYQETEAQLRCVQEIKEDMEKAYPMDRLLCGDVGFGKTEVALRAAFKCVSSSKQCAILVPTTILAWQHYNTIKDRFKDFPVEVEMISRFRTVKEQKKILERLKSGEIDILVGTHRIVQSDVKFRDLGLLIVDEEQRFGVLQKEKLKELTSNTDILTMSATPIPRTLNMAISGVRDLSSLEEPPKDRYPVQTYVLEYDQKVINEAIEKEIKRGGQVYFLHNKIDSISNVAYRIQKQIPSAKVGIGHSKMTEEELSEVWRQLIDGEINVLICTTIIESGIDVPNVNTLIVDNADHMGLSQLYQLRGRVGRSNRRAYAYLTFRANKALTEIAMKRLNAIRDFTEFGSGFKISMRDLELRGAGNILGGEQHGHMDAVGYDMYMKLLSDAVKNEKGETTLSEEKECLIDIEMQAHIPEKYIRDLNQRLSVYRLIADIKTVEDANGVKDELKDRFGKIPQPVLDLIDVAIIKNMAAKLSIYEIKQTKDGVFFNLTDPDMNKISSLVGVMKKRVMFNAGKKPYISVKMRTDDEILPVVKTVVELLTKFN